MKRHRSLIPLSRFHRKILGVAQMLKRDAPAVKGYPEEVIEQAAYTQDFYYQQLMHHFHLESEALFKPLRGRDGRMDRIIEELEQQRSAIGRMVEALSLGGDLESRLHILGTSLEAHVRQEERQFFQTVQELLDEDEFISIEKRMQQRLSRLDNPSGYVAGAERSAEL